MSRKASHHTQPIQLCGGWERTSEDHFRLHSCQLEAGIWGYHGQRLTQTRWSPCAWAQLKCSREHVFRAVQVNGTWAWYAAITLDVGGQTCSGADCMDCLVRVGTKNKVNHFQAYTHRFRDRGAIISTIAHKNNTRNIPGKSGSQTRQWVVEWQLECNLPWRKSWHCASPNLLQHQKHDEVENYFVQTFSSTSNETSNVLTRNEMSQWHA